MSIKVLQRTLVVLVTLLAFGANFVAAQDSTITGPGDASLPHGGTLVLTQGPKSSFVRNFNPFAPNPNDGTTQMIYEPLIVFNFVDSGKPTYWLATDAKYSDDLLTLTFTLRDGVKWSDGEPFSADDVVFTFDLVKANPSLDKQGILPFVDSATKIDDHTVAFNLKDVYTQADTVIGHQIIVPEHVWKDVTDPVTFTNDNPVATGAFTEVKDFSDQVYTICRNPNYWQENKPYVDCLQYPAYSGNDPVGLALINGDLDWAEIFISDIDTTFVAKDPEHNHYFFPGNNPWALYLNARKAPWNDVKMRQAVSQAIDYETISTTAENGYTKVEQNNAIGIWPQFKDWVGQDVLDKVKELGLGVYDPELAKKTLDDAGYKVGSDGFRTMPDGTSIGRFDIQIVNGWGDVTTATQIISQNLQDIGLDANVVTPDFGQWQSNLQQGTFDASLGWSLWRRTPWDTYHNIFDSAYDPVSAQFFAGWSSPESDKLFADFVKTADPDEQKAIVNKLAMAFTENVVMIPLSPWPTWYEYTTHHFTGWPDAENYYAFPAADSNESARIISMTVHCIDTTSCGQ